MPITLNCPRIGLRGGTNISDEPNPDSDDAAKIHYNSFENDVYELSFIIDVTSVADRALLKEINVLNRTNGIKLIYASDTSDTLKTLLELIGRTDTKFNISNPANVSGSTLNLNDIPVVIGRFIGKGIDNIATSRKFMITGSLTFREEKVVVQ